MKEKYAVSLCIIAVMISGITGCSNTTTSNIKAGMDAIGIMDYETALASFEKAIVTGENKEEAYRGQGLAFMGLTQYEEAQKALLEALNSHVGRPDALAFDINYYLAASYYKTGDLSQAADVYSAILELKPEETQAYYLRGCAELDSNQYEKAIADYEAAMLLAPQDYDLFIDIFLKLDQNGYTDAGTVYLQTLLDENNEKMNLYDQGRICYYLKDYENARNHLEEARLDSNDADIITMLGKTYEALGDNNYAATIYTGYLKETQSADIWNRLGLCRMELEDYQSALEAFQTGIKLNDSQMMQTLSYNEVVAYEYLQQYNQAIVSMEAYLDKYPDDAKALREYEFLKTR